VKPVTTPLLAPTTATPGVPLIQVPPDVVLVQVADEATHRRLVPVMVCGTGVVIVTVCEAVFTHPPEVVTAYVIKAVPAVTPVTTPFKAPMTAIPEAELVHVPPVVVLAQVCDVPMQTGVVPVMVWEIGAVMVTVFVAVFTQPPKVNE